MKSLDILVIEDDENDFEILERKLKQHKLTWAPKMKEAMKLLDAVVFDIVILDLKLSNGVKETVLDQVKAKHKGPVIVLTGDEDPRTRDHMRHRKADFFVVKGREDSAEDLQWMIEQARKKVR